MRIVHLVKPALTLARPPGVRAGFDDGTDAAILACRCTIAAARSISASTTHEVVVIGSAEQARRAAMLGLEVSGRITPPAGILGFAGTGLRAILGDRTDVGLVQCWSKSLVDVAHASAPRKVRVLPPPNRFVCIPPSTTRADLRASLGLSPDDFCVLLLADPPGTGDVRSFAFVLGLFEVAGHVTVGVVPRGVRGWSRARRFVKASDLRCRLVLADNAASVLAPACDVAVGHAEPEEFDGRPLPRHAERLAAERSAVNTCHAAGVPVVTVKGRGLDDLYTSLPILLSESDHANHVGRVVLALKNDRSLLTSIQRKVRASVPTPDLGELVESWFRSMNANSQSVQSAGSIAG